MLTLDVLFDRLEQMPVPEGYKVEIVGGSIFLSPQHGQHWDIIFNIAEQLRAHYARKRLSSDVRYDFPGYLNGFCPDLAALKEGAEKDDQGQYAYDDIEFVLEQGRGDGHLRQAARPHRHRRGTDPHHGRLRGRLTRRKAPAQAGVRSRTWRTEEPPSLSGAYVSG